MVIGQKILIFTIVILFCFLLVAQTANSNRAENPMGVSALPPELLRPRYGESPHFPQDYVIGTLGRCDASEESYRYARLIVAGLAAGNGKAEGVVFPEQKRLSVLKSISGLGTRSWRVGGGRVEPDGSVSYLIRFLGRENSVTGELYLRREEIKTEQEIKPEQEIKQETEIKPETENEVKEEAKKDDERREETTVSWRVDDILLENPHSLYGGKYSPGGTEMTAYERFF